MYDYAGVSASLGVKVSDLQAIKSALMPAVQPEPRKPTEKEYKATIKEQKREIKTLGRKLQMSEEATAKLKKVVERKSRQIKSLSDQLKEEKRSYRTSNMIMESTKKKADEAALKLRLLQSDLAVTISRIDEAPTIHLTFDLCFMCLIFALLKESRLKNCDLWPQTGAKHVIQQSATNRKVWP